MDGCESLTVRRDGIRVRKSIVADDADLLVKLSVESDRGCPVAVRISDTSVAPERAAIDVAVPSDGDCRWTTSDEGVTLARSIVPGDSFVTEYRVVDSDRADVSRTLPVIEAVQPIDQRDIDAGIAPRWRGSGEGAVAATTTTGREELLSVGGRAGSSQPRSGVESDSGSESGSEVEPIGETEKVNDAVTEAIRSSRIVVGIPAYNESVGIGSIVLAAKRYADEIVVVDDGSTDSTIEIAKRAGATVLEHGTNEGKGRAIKTLFEHARSLDFDAFVLIDGDGQHLPSDIPQVAGSVISGESDLAIGSRYLEKRDADETPRYRRFGQRALDLLTLGSTNVNLTDTQSGFRALSPEAVNALVLRTDGFGIETEMIDVAVRTGLTIREEPIDVKYDGIDGQTYSPLRHGLTVALFILQLIRDRHPILFFGVPGLLLLLAGVLYGFNAVLVYQGTGVFYPAKVLVSGIVTIIGILGVFAGLVLNRISHLLVELDSPVRG